MVYVVIKKQNYEIEIHAIKSNDEIFPFFANLGIVTIISPKI